jgi:hypothetical protein
MIQSRGDGARGDGARGDGARGDGARGGGARVGGATVYIWLYINEEEEGNRLLYTSKIYITSKLFISYKIRYMLGQCTEREVKRTRVFTFNGIFTGFSFFFT